MNEIETKHPSFRSYIIIDPANMQTRLKME